MHLAVNTCINSSFVHLLYMICVHIALLTGLSTHGIVCQTAWVVTAESTSIFKTRLDTFWHNQDIMYDYIMMHNYREPEVDVKFRIKKYKCYRKCTKSREKRLRPALVHLLYSNPSTCTYNTVIRWHPASTEDPAYIRDPASIRSYTVFPHRILSRYLKCGAL